MQAGFSSGGGRQYEGVRVVIALGGKVTVVCRGQMHSGGHLFGDVDAEGNELGGLSGLLVSRRTLLTPRAESIWAAAV